MALGMSPGGDHAVSVLESAHHAGMSEESLDPRSLAQATDEPGELLGFKQPRQASTLLSTDPGSGVTASKSEHGPRVGRP